MVKTKILLVAEDGIARKAYTDVLYMLGTEVVCIGSPDEISGALADDLYSGLLVDIPTMIKCESSDKNRISRIMNRFPVLRLMFNAEFGGIRGVAHGGTMKDNRDLAEFILEECVPFVPRSIRVTQRHDLVFNVLLLDELKTQDIEAERTVTVNVSEHGCFVFSVSEWQVDHAAWIIINEFEDKTPVQLRVRWCGQWGHQMRMPGIGASFESMTTHQCVQLHSYL